MQSVLPEARTLGFIGLGVMGAPESANLVRRSGLPLVAFDVDETKVADVVAVGARAAGSIAQVAAECDVVFLSLPGGPQVESVIRGSGGLMSGLRSGQIVVDLSTSPVELTQELSEQVRAKGAVLVDAPVARTRKAAIEGTLSIMVGADADSFAVVEPLLRCMASDVTHCGDVGAGQLVKILNNTVVFETVVALSEAITVARQSGLVEDDVLFSTFAAGSAASFALSHHGMTALLPDEHPVGVFSSSYMAKDIGYALEAGAKAGVRMPAASLAVDLLRQTIELGFGDSYHTAVVRVIEGA